MLSVQPVTAQTLSAAQIEAFISTLEEVSPGVYSLAGITPTLPADALVTNINAADTTNANQLWTAGGLDLNLTGAGVDVGVWDGGEVRATHQEFSNGSRVTVVDSVALSDHATHVAGTIGAQGVNANARGMADQAAIRSRDYLNDASEMLADASILDLSNHSYGFLRGWTQRISWSGLGFTDTWMADRALFTQDPNFGKYTGAQTVIDASLGIDLVTPQALDDILFDNPYLLSVWSAGNDRTESFTNLLGNNRYVAYSSTAGGWVLINAGPTPAPGGDGAIDSGFDTLPQSQVAKNSLTIGAIHDITADPYTSGDVSITSFSSWGMTDDGRIKADLVANGASLTSSVSTSDSAYGGFSGTSMSAPNATGSAALLVQHYRNLFAGASPRSATTKGLLIHTASDAGNIGPDYSFGWGVLDAAAAANLLTDAAAPSPQTILEEDTYSGTNWTKNIVSAGTTPLKVTIVWSDPAPTTLPDSGLDVSTPVLVNDLDLWISGPGGETFLPWTLDRLSPASPAVRTAANHVDNVEQVLIDLPGAGEYTIHIGNIGAAFTQDFSLVVSGATAVNTPPTDPANLALPAIDEDIVDASNSGRLASDIVTASGSIDPNGDLLGIAVTTVDNANGHWQYSLDAGGSWQDILAATPTAARLLAPEHLVRFVPNPDFNSQVATSPTISFKVWDQTAGVAGETADTTTLSAYSAIAANATQPVDEVNDAPSFTLPSSLVEQNEDAGAVAVGRFAIDTAPGPATATDEAAQILTFLVVVLGTTGNLAFDAAPSIDAATGELTFTAATDTNGAATIEVVLQDDGSGTPPHVNSSAAQNFTIEIAPVNDEQVLATNGGLTADEGSATEITTASLETTDVDNLPRELIYTVESGPSYGALRVSGNPATQFTQQDVSDDLVIYAHDGGETSSDNFYFTVDDGQGTASSGTFSITITPVNDEQVLATNAGLTLNEGASDTITAARLETTDVDDLPGELIYTGESGPSYGALLVSGSPATQFTQQEINDGLVSYAHDDGETLTDSFHFTIDDGQGTASSGTFSITITPVNDEQVLATNADVTVDQGALATITTTFLETSDIDNVPTELVYLITSGPAYGMLLVGGLPATQFTQQDVNDGVVSYEHDGTENFADSFGFTVDDGQGAASSGTFSIAIRPLAGDYNRDNFVNAADHVLWRKTLGTMGVPAYTAADGDGDTTIDDDDYGVWFAHFGETAGTGSAAGIEQEAGRSEQGDAEFRIADFGLRNEKSGEQGATQRVPGRESVRSRVASEGPSWHDDALVAWVASRRAEYGGDETQKDGVIESLGGRESDEEARRSVFGAVDAVFEKLLVGVGEM